MLGNRLALNSDKTHFMIISSQSQHRKNNYSGVILDTGSEIIKPSENECILGLHVSNDLSWNVHIASHEKSIVKTLTFKINGLSPLCYEADFKTSKILANGLVNSNLVYMIQLYGQASDYLIKMLQVQQNRAARLVTKLGWDTRTSELLKQVGWLSVRQLFVFHSLVLVWKIKKSEKPYYLNKKFYKNFSYGTRQATSNCFVVNTTPRCEFSRKSFVHSSTVLWNTLPTDLRNSSTLQAFKLKLKLWVIQNIQIK